MTVMIPEAVGAAEAGGASAGAGAGAGAGKVLEPTSIRSPARGGSRAPARTRERAPARRSSGPPPDRPRGGGGGGGGGRGGRYYYLPPERQSTGRRTSGPSLSLPSYEPQQVSYHGIVIAEFVVTIILIGMSPFLTPRTPTSGSPSDEAKAAAAATSLAGPLVRLTAACIVFFALALLSTGPKTGKIAAAAGGLVVLGTLLNATDMFTAISQAFGAGKPSKGSPASSPASGPVVPSEQGTFGQGIATPAQLGIELT